jgi:hypothetical protein
MSISFYEATLFRILEQMCHVVQTCMLTCMRPIRILTLGKGKHACALL